jgi:hypothetical protein
LKEEGVRLFALFSFNHNAKKAHAHRLEIMIHTKKMRSKDFFELIPANVPFGEGGFTVFSNAKPFKLPDEYRKDF